jgi:tetratricopeptide (TPR) repeat protein
MRMVGKRTLAGEKASYQRGIRLFDQGQYEEAIQEFDSVLERCPDDRDLSKKLATFYSAEAHANLASIYERHGNPDRAIKELEEAVELNPDYPDLRYQLAHAYYTNEQPNEALLQLNIALELNPDYARARCLYGAILYGQGREEAGLAAIADAADIEPAFETQDLKAAFEAHKTGDRNGALDLLTRVADTRLDDIAHHVARGREYTDKGLLEEAAIEFQHALELSPNYADVRNNLGIVYGQMMDFEKAVEQFKRALGINPEYIAARLNLAIAYDLMGDSNAAHAEFKEVLRRDPDNEVAKREIEELAE